MTPDEIKEDIEKTLTQFVNENDAIAIPYLKEFEGSMKQRIHNKGLDSSGQVIGTKAKRGGKYSPGYEKKKIKRVGQANIYPINLQFKGDLLRSFTVGTTNDKAALRFQDESNSNKAAFNEKNFKTDIYRPSESELEDAKEVLITVVEEELSRLFNL